MGILQEIAGPVVDRFTERSTAVVVLALLAAGVVLVVVANVLKQLLFRKPNEPPVVFHWLPLLGSTVEYGMDPYRFFFRCREKVIVLAGPPPRPGVRIEGPYHG